MKKLGLLISCFIFSSASMAASPEKSGANISWHNYKAVPTKYNKKAKKINCAQFIDQTYTFIEHNGAFNLPGVFQYKNPKSYSVSQSHGIISRHWSGTWVYDQPNGKTYPSKVYGAQVAFTKSHLAFGIYENKYCRGSYQTTQISAKKEKNKSFIKKLLGRS